MQSDLHPETQSFGTELPQVFVKLCLDLLFSGMHESSAYIEPFDDIRRSYHFAFWFNIL
jgi:hypothetical protein